MLIGLYLVIALACEWASTKFESTLTYPSLGLLNLDTVPSVPHTCYATVLLLYTRIAAIYPPRATKFLS